MGVTGQKWGLSIRVDTRALKSLTDGAEKIAKVSAELKELRASTTGVVEGMGDNVSKLNEGLAKTVASLRVEVATLRREWNAAKQSGAGGGGAGGAAGGGNPNWTWGNRNKVPSQGRAGKPTIKFMRDEYGVPESTFAGTSQGGRNAAGTGMPKPHGSPGNLWYTNKQITSILFYDKITRPIVAAIQNLQTVATGGKGGGGADDHLDKAMAGRLEQSMTSLATSINRLADAVSKAPRDGAQKTPDNTAPPIPGVRRGPMERLQANIPKVWGPLGEVGLQQFENSRVDNSAAKQAFVAEREKAYQRIQEQADLSENAKQKLLARHSAQTAKLTQGKDTNVQQMRNEAIRQRRVQYLVEQGLRTDSTETSPLTVSKGNRPKLQGARE